MDDEEEENGRPRRLDEETAKYLVELDVQLSKQSENEVDNEILVENVLNELKTKTASAASDRRTHEFIEKICFASNMKYLLEIFQRCTPYGLFLSKNRYSAHVLQAAFATFCSTVKRTGFDESKEEEIVTSILGFANPILENIVELAKEINGTHVVRAIICALAGLPLLSERKGKESKHQHSIRLSEPLDSVMCPNRFYVSPDKTYTVPDEFHEALGTAVASLLTLSDIDLHALVDAPSPCAVMGLLLQILFSPTLVAGGPELADRLVRAVLCWDSSEGSSVLYAMSGDRSGSYFYRLPWSVPALL